MARLTIEATSSDGPTPQLLPQASSPCVRWMAANSFGVNDIIVRPLVSKLSVRTTGRPVERAPAIAASTSSLEDIVSIHSTSAPPAASAPACSAKATRAASTDSGPSWLRISPVGPMLPATTTSRPLPSASVRAMRAAAALSSWTRSSAWCSLSR